MIYILIRTYSIGEYDDRQDITELVCAFTSKTAADAVLKKIASFRKKYREWQALPKTNIAQLMPKNAMKMPPDEYKVWYEKYQRGEVGECEVPEPKVPVFEPPVAITKEQLVDSDYDFAVVEVPVYEGKQS